jgi:hypothetical protein
MGDCSEKQVEPDRHVAALAEIFGGDRGTERLRRRAIRGSY